MIYNIAIIIKENKEQSLTPTKIIRNDKNKEKEQSLIPTKYTHWQVMSGERGIYYIKVGDGERFQWLKSCGPLPGHGQLVRFIQKEITAFEADKAIKEQLAPYGKVVDSGFLN